MISIQSVILAIYKLGNKPYIFSNATNKYDSRNPGDNGLVVYVNTTHLPWNQDSTKALTNANNN